MSELIKLTSLDVSSTCTGYSQFILNLSEDTFEYLNTSSIKSSKKDLYSRLEYINNEFVNRDLYTWCDEVVFENYAFNGNRVTQLAEINGVLKYNYYLNNKKINIISPNTIKKLVTGHGHANKNKVREAITSNNLFEHVIFKNNDESDSLAVGYAHILKQISKGD